MWGKPTNPTGVVKPCTHRCPDSLESPGSGMHGGVGSERLDQGEPLVDELDLFLPDGLDE